MKIIQINKLIIPLKNVFIYLFNLIFNIRFVVVSKDHERELIDNVHKLASEANYFKTIDVSQSKYIILYSIN